MVGRYLRWFTREWAPQSLLALTERELVLLCQERSWSWAQLRPPAKYGAVATYCPLARLAGFRVQEDGRCATLEVVRAEMSRLRLRVPDREHFEAEAVRISRNNLHVLMQLCRLAAGGGYVFGKHFSTQLLDLDCRINRLGLQWHGVEPQNQSGR